MARVTFLAVWLGFTLALFAGEAHAPPVAGAIAAYMVSTMVTAYVASVVGSIILSQVIGALAGALLSVAINAAFSKKPRAPEPSFSQNTSQNMVSIRQAIAPWRVIYGEARVGGAITYMESTTSDHELHIVLTLACHEVTEIGDVYFDDEVVPITDNSAVGKYAGHVRVFKSLGNEGSGQPFPELAAFSSGGWGNNQLQQGRAKLYVKLVFNRDLFPTGVPNITCMVKGRKVLDPRTGGTQWSANPALCIADYLTNTSFGLGAAWSEIDTTDLAAAASVCDEEVTISERGYGFRPDASKNVIYGTGGLDPDFRTGTGVRFTGTGSPTTLPPPLAENTTYYLRFVGLRSDRSSYEYEVATTMANAFAGNVVTITNVNPENTVNRRSEPRFTLDGFFNVEQTPRSILEELASAFAGTIRFVGGKWNFYPAAYRTPTVTLTEDDLRGPVRLLPRLSRRDLANGIKGLYANLANNYQPTDYPPVTNATYLAQDQGDRIWREVDLPYTRSTPMAQRIAKIELERNRQQIVVELQCNLSAFRVEPGDVVLLTLARYGWSAKAFEVVELALAAEDSGDGARLGVDLVLRETASAVYDWSAGEETTIDFAPDTELPDPWTVDAPGDPAIAEQVYETREGRGVAAKAVVSWAASENGFAALYQLEHKLSADSIWTVYPRTENTTFDVLDVAPGVYDFRVKVVSALGVSSAYATSSNVTITGLAAVPSAPAGLGLQAAGGLAILTLDQSADLDVRRGGRVLVRHCAALSGATWPESFSIGNPDGYAGDSTIIALPLKEGTYLVKFRDSSGIESAAAASISTRQVSVLAYSPLSTLVEQTAFSGTHSNTVTTGGILKLDGAGSFDSIPDVDAAAVIDEYGGVVASGTYTFAAGVDLGSVKSVRLTGLIEGTTSNVNDLFDSRLESLDDWLSFDGDTGGGEVDAWIEVRETDDAPVGSPSPAWGTWKRLDAAEVNARGIEARLRMVSYDTAYNCEVRTLELAAEEL